MYHPPRPNFDIIPPPFVIKNTPNFTAPSELPEIPKIKYKSYKNILKNGKLGPHQGTHCLLEALKTNLQCTAYVASLHAEKYSTKSYPWKSPGNTLVIRWTFGRAHLFLHICSDSEGGFFEATVGLNFWEKIFGSILIIFEGFGQFWWFWRSGRFF